MNWNKAINKIEQAIANDDYVAIEYHRKWMKQDAHYMKVESIAEYEWKGQICKAINLFDGGSSDQINEGSHIIDAVTVDSFFYTHSGKVR